MHSRLSQLFVGFQEICVIAYGGQDFQLLQKLFSHSNRSTAKTKLNTLLKVESIAN